MAEKVPVDATTHMADARHGEQNDHSDNTPKQDNQNHKTEDEISYTDTENVGTKSYSDLKGKQIGDGDFNTDAQNLSQSSFPENSSNRYDDSGYSFNGAPKPFRDSVGKTSQGSGHSKAASTQVKSPGEALEALFDQLGHFSFYQCYIIILLCIPNILAAMYTLNYVFVADQVPFRCIVPECEGTNNVQFDNATAAALQSAHACRRYEPLDPNRATCDRDRFHPNDTIPCTMFVYESMETVYSEFGLACQEWRRTLVGTVRNAALPLALLITGYLSDGWGRRTSFCILVVFLASLGIVKSFSINYQMYITMEFLEAALGYGANSAVYVMMVELARPSLRGIFACITGVSYGLGGVLFALIASQVRYWRTLLRVIHTPALLLPLYWLLLDESIRWLHVTRRTDRAVAVLRKAAAWNKVTLNEDYIKVLHEDPEKEVAKPKLQWISLVKSRVLLLRFLVCAWCWVSAAFVYYGLTINSVSLSGDKYVNFALVMAMEIVASLLLMMSLEKFGRKRSIFAAFLLCGISCVIPYFISHTGAELALFFVGKLSISFAFNSLYVFTTELFPTDARTSALAATSIVGRLGSVLAPQTPLLSMYVQVLLYGGVSLLAALAVLLVPETRRAPLPARVRDAERLRSPNNNNNNSSSSNSAEAGVRS